METASKFCNQYGNEASFPGVGLGIILGSSFAKKYAHTSNYLPSIFRGNTLFVGSDYSGQHKSSKYDIYSVAIYDLESCRAWEIGRNEVRQTFGLSKRRMSFKSLNDRRRRKALVPFLRNAENSPGIFATFAVSKSGGSLFQRDEPVDDKISRLLEAWKPKIRERLLTAIHLVSFLLAGVSRFWDTGDDAWGVVVMRARARSD